MEGTWLASSVEEPVRRARLAFLGSIVAGLFQKPMIVFAWDVKMFMHQLCRVHRQIRAGTSGSLLVGGTAILLRQVFAWKGQAVVGDLAETLAVAGKTWDKPSLALLIKKLDRMEPRHTMKRMGRMARFSGPRWLRGLWADARQRNCFDKVSRVLGDVITSTVVEAGAFHQMCNQMKQPDHKLRHLSEYSCPQLVRACFVGRAHIQGLGGEGAVHIDRDVWPHLRQMTEDRTKKMFDMLSVVTFEEAQCVLGTVRDLASRVWSSRIAAHYSSMSLLDLPCQACEFGGTLCAVKRTHGCGDVEAIEWVLQHLPSDLTKLKAVGRAQKVATEAVLDKGDGLDRQCACSVTSRWLKRGPKAQTASLWTANTCGRGDIFGLPLVTCPRCEQPMPIHGQGRKRTQCTACKLAVRRFMDAERQAKKRRLAKPGSTG